MSEYIAEFFDNPEGQPVKFNGFKEEIVRCKDCRFAEHNKFGFEPMDSFGYSCTFWDLEIALGVEPDGYCKWGEKNG